MSDMSASAFPVPDPTVRTIETLEREVDWLQERSDLQRESDATINAERHASQRREDEIREAHRLELKADNQRTVETAMIAAEKAVQAALAAAEKARDQQTIASQLATEKAEKAGKEQMEQQGTTFTLAISGLTTGLGDVKSLMSELRAEKRGGQEQVVDRRASTTQMILAGGAVGTLLGVIFGVLSRMIG